MKRVLEIACFNLESALLAQEAGADRIELCENYAEGGLTPSEKLISDTRRELKIPVHVIIRPRGGNFLYSEVEKEEMKRSILFCKENAVNGVVFGCLLADKSVDVATCQELKKLAAPMSVTFHRAIDECADISKGLEALIDLGFNRVLSSGGEAAALEGKERLRALHASFKNKIIILPGRGIRSGNLMELVEATNCFEYHSAALSMGSSVCDPNEIRKMKIILLST